MTAKADAAQSALLPSLIQDNIISSTVDVSGPSTTKTINNIDDFNLANTEGFVS
jgi:hypothetical protein